MENPAPDNAVRYSRPVPDEWSDLLDHARRILPDNRLYLRDSDSEDLLNAIGSLDPEIMDANRYYGLGLIMCGMAKELRQPEVRASVTKEASNLLVHRWVIEKGPYRGRLTIKDVRGAILNSAFEEPAQSGNNALPAEARFLCDALTIARQRWFRSKRINFAFDIYADTDLIKMQTGGSAATAVVDDAASAGSTVLRTILRGRQQFLADTGSGVGDSAVDIIQSEPDSLNYRNIARRCAGLRIDEFGERVSDFVSVEDTGYVRFANDVFKNSKLEDPVLEIAHKQRLHCPARYVQGLIDTVVQIIPEAVIRADQQIQKL